jgi:predicted small lipoprotein YifL
MKNLNLSLIVLLFSSLLIGCGMKGPLYREVSPAPKAEEVQQLNNVTDTNKTDA